MPKRTTQDDERENMQCELFNLRPGPGRSNKYVPDAFLEIDGKEYALELKTSDVEKKQVSSARNVTLSKIEEWEKVLWLFSSYSKSEDGSVELIEHYLGDKKILKEWFDKQREKIILGTKTYAGLELWMTARDILREHLGKRELSRLNASFEKKGVGLNDPKIPWSYIQKHCIRLKGDNLQKELREAISTLQ